MSKFSDDLVGGAVLLILTHQFFDFYKFVADKLATVPRPSSPTATGFTNPLRAALVSETPQPAIRFPFPWNPSLTSPAAPPAIPLLPRVRISHRRPARNTYFFPEETKVEVVGNQQQESNEVALSKQETKTVLVTEMRVDRRHTELTQRVERCIKDRQYLLTGLYGSRESRKKASEEIARLVCGTADTEKLPRNLNQYLGRAYPRREKEPPKRIRRVVDGE